MVCEMELNDSFWKHFELDLQEIKLSYLNWTIGYAKEPRVEYRHLFQWDHQDRFCPINSRYGRAFSFIPFGPGVRGVPGPTYKGIPRGLDEIDIALKARLTKKHRIHSSCNCECTGKRAPGRCTSDGPQLLLAQAWSHELLFGPV